MVRKDIRSTRGNTYKDFTAVRFVNFTSPRRKPKTTWVSKIKSNLNEMNISWIEAENFAKVDPNEWIRRVNLYTKKTIKKIQSTIKYQ